MVVVDDVSHGMWRQQQPLGQSEPHFRDLFLFTRLHGSLLLTHFTVHMVQDGSQVLIPASIDKNESLLNVVKRQNRTCFWFFIIF